MSQKFEMRNYAMKETYVYKITEENVDGCGEDAVEFISANTPVSGRAALLFEECLRKSKLDYGNRDFDTSSMVEEALKAFSAQTGIKVELCAAPYQGEFKF